MRLFAFLWFCIIALLILGCGERAAPLVAGPVAAPPVASAGVSATVEQVNTSHANAVAMGDKLAIKATETLQVDTTKSEQIASLRWLPLLGVLLAAAGGFLIYDGSAKLGIGLAIAGASCALGSMLLVALIPYEGRIAAGVVVTGLVAFIYHYRSKFAAAARSLELHAIALEHAVSHIPIGTELRHGVVEVETLLYETWSKAKSEAVAIATKLHLIHAIPPAPVSTAAPAAPPAPKAP